MIHKNQSLLREMSGPGRCEWCSFACYRDPHHLWKRGMSGGSRLDIRVNIASLCRECHDRTELPRGKQQITRTDLLRIVAKRERTTPRAIECVHGWLDRLDKDASPERVELSMKLLSPGAGELAARVWREIQESKAKRRSA